EGDPISHNESFWPVIGFGKKIGHVSRCVWTPRLERNIGFANVPASSTAVGTALTVESPAGARDAVVVKAPWFPAQKEIPAGIRD
ncbi:MAG: glycine cleavage T C-terminal barrel domain-containing protein, partial [Lysobacterales bacterium]